MNDVRFSIRNVRGLTIGTSVRMAKMRYRLSTLMIVMAGLPPILWAAVVYWSPEGAAVVAIISAFVFLDVALETSELKAPIWRRIIVKTSHYATAFAFAVFAGGYLYAQTEYAKLARMSPPKPAASLQEAYDQFGQGLAEALGPALVFVLCFFLSIVFSLTATLFALTVVSRSRWALCLLAANLPWDALIAYGLIAEYLK